MSSIHRRQFLAAVGAGVVGAALPWPALGASPGAERPNVLFIAIDDLKPLTGAYGNPVVQTPHLDRLAGRSIIFSNNHCQQAVCGPSRASLMTGLRPDTTKVWDLKTKMRDINPDILTIPQHFKNNGYYAIGSGKMFDGRCCDGWVSQDRVSWSEPCEGVGGRRYALEHEGRPPTEAADVPDDTYRDARRALKGIELLRRAAAQERPFFVGLGFSLPHLPFAAPARYWDLYDPAQFELHPFQERPEDAPPFAYQDSWELRGGYSGVPEEGPIPPELQLELIHGYYASTSFVDAQAGRVLEELHRLGLADSTVVSLWGDHGWHLGDHGMWCKHTNYEQATRSPLFVAAPGLTDGGLVSESPTEFVDIFPTLCELTGLPLPEGLEGVSLLTLMHAPSATVKAAAISQYHRRRAGKPVMGYAYRNRRYRYLEWVQKDFRRGQQNGPVVARELYDYREDPLETANLVDQPGCAKTVEWFEQRARHGWRGFLPRPPA